MIRFISGTIAFALTCGAFVSLHTLQAEDAWIGDAPEIAEEGGWGYWSDQEVSSSSPELMSDTTDGLRRIAAVSTAEDCLSCGQSNECACAGRVGLRGRGWLDNTSFLFAGDGWKSIFDDDDNNNFGLRAGFNTGFSLLGDRPVRGQLGASFGAYDFHGREGLINRDDQVEQQLFVTAGLYKRSDVCRDDRLAWGVVYDLMASEDIGEAADDIRLAQIRSSVGYAINSSNEVGVWAAFRLMSSFADIELERVDVMDQVSLFWHRTWSYGGDTWLYAGWADDPGETVVGLRGTVPLNDRVSLLGNVHYVIPSTTGGDMHPTLPVDDVFNQETWNVSFGIVFYPGAESRFAHRLRRTLPATAARRGQRQLQHPSAHVLKGNAPRVVGMNSLSWGATVVFGLPWSPSQ